MVTNYDGASPAAELHSRPVPQEYSMAFWMKWFSKRGSRDKPEGRQGEKAAISKPSMLYIQITTQEPIKVIHVSTQVHYLLTPGEARDPDATFRDLTVGGVEVSGGDKSHSAHYLSSERVTALTNALQTLSWESLEAEAKAGCDMMPGWHVGLQPDFEKIRDFFSDASEKRCAVLRVR